MGQLRERLLGALHGFVVFVKMNLCRFVFGQMKRAYNLEIFAVKSEWSVLSAMTKFCIGAMKREGGGVSEDFDRSEILISTPDSKFNKLCGVRDTVRLLPSP